MHIEHQKWFSKHLNQDTDINVYGQSGLPVLHFPTENGDHRELESSGLLNAYAPFIEAGTLQVFSVNTIDHESWKNKNADPADRALRHEDYDRYITQEVVPFIRQNNGSLPQKIIACGISMGGYHATNFFFRHPDMFNTLISISGFFQLRKFIGSYSDLYVYLNTPLYYLPNLTDPWYLDQFRQSKINFCVGRGEGESEMLNDAHAIKEILEKKNIPFWLDKWGEDVTHSWGWWQKQLPHMIERILAQQPQNTP